MNNMKYIFYLIMIILSFSCNNKANYDEQEITKHELKKFNVKDLTSTHSSGSYFILMGSYSLHETQINVARFYYKNCKGEFQFLELDQRMVRICIENTENAYVTFKTSSYSKCFDNDFNWCISYATVHCKDSDFLYDVNINTLK